MKKRYKLLIGLTGIILIGFVLPEPRSIPVAGATQSDWNKDSFGRNPGERRGSTKGLISLHQKGTPAITTANLSVLYSGQSTKGRKIVVGLALNGDYTTLLT